MNILYIVQQSVYTSQGKWSTADSNIQMMRGLIKEILRHTNDIHFYVVLGAIETFEDINYYGQIIDHSNVHFCGYHFPVDAFLNRQHFDVFEFENLMQALPKMDIIWNNITEISRNIKTWMYYRKYEAKLITSCYWLDCPMINEEKVPIDVSYMWRQFDGFLCSDLVTFTCKSTQSAFRYNAAQVFKRPFIDDILSKSIIFDFGYQANELGKPPFDKAFPPIIVFLNRMSGINYTHHEEFINAIKILYSWRDDFEVVFTNPSKKIDPKWLEQEVPNYVNYKNKHDQIYSRKEYIELIQASSISVHLFDTERYGGCAHREAIHCANIPITLNLHEYSRIQGPSYPFYIAAIKPKLIAETLNFVLDNLDSRTGYRCSRIINGPHFNKIRERNYESSYEAQAPKILTALEDLL